MFRKVTFSIWVSYFSNLKRSFTISRRVFVCKTAAMLHLATSVLSMWIMDHKKGHKQDKGLKPWKYILTINASNQLDALGHEWEGSSTRAKERKVLSTIKKCKVGLGPVFRHPSYRLIHLIMVAISTLEDE